MPLSRNFYSLEEVHTSLHYTTANNKISEALFWCQELIVSGCHTEAISTLFQSWLWNRGSARLEWLVNAWKTLASDELNVSDLLLATYQLASTPHTYSDNSLWNILVMTIRNPNEMPDRVTRKTPNNVPFTDDKELYFVRAIFQGKARSAWWISQYIDTTRIWEILSWFATTVHSDHRDKYTTCLDAFKGYERLLGYQSAEYDVITRCAAILSLCISSEAQDKTFKCLDSQLGSADLKWLSELEVLDGRKNRRIYTIPKECLYGITQRGRSKWSQNTFVQLNNVEKYIIGCPFWDEVLSEYANVTDENEITWLSEDKMEEFYNIYFPDDIPDEWLKSDKLKSHGDGVLSPTEKPTIAKYSRMFLSKFPKLAWNTTKAVNTYLDTLDVNDCSIENIIKLYRVPSTLSDLELKKLVPVRKIKVSN
jgi:hypothetical protein